MDRISQEQLDNVSPFSFERMISEDNHEEKKGKEPEDLNLESFLLDAEQEQVIIDLTANDSSMTCLKEVGSEVAKIQESLFFLNKSVQKEIFQIRESLFFLNAAIKQLHRNLE